MIETERIHRLRLRCPHCRQTLDLIPKALRCAPCSREYALDGLLVDLLDQAPGRRTLAQKAMEWPPLIRVYESRFWRRSPVPARAFGITFDDEYRTIVRAAGLTGSETLLDLACGTGIYTRPLARNLPEGMLAGVDLSLPMLAYADRRARAEQLHSILYVRASAMDLPFADGAFDVVNCCGAIHMFPDLDAALGEIRRVLRFDGRFTVATFLKPPGERGERIARFRRRFIGDNAYRPEELAGHLARSGLTDATVHHAAGAWMIVSARAGTPVEANTTSKDADAGVRYETAHA